MHIALEPAALAATLATGTGNTAFTRILLCIVIILIAGRLAGMVFKRLGQPVVIGEILVGIALGPSLFGAVAPGVSDALFDGVVPSLKVMASVGLVLFMFVVGLEVDPAIIRRNGSRALAISLTSIALPFVLGFFLLGPHLPEDSRCVVVAVAELGADDVECTSDEVIAAREDTATTADASTPTGTEASVTAGDITGRQIPYTPYAMFIGVAMCGTAFAVLARILAERNMFRIPLGLLLIACAAIDDIVAFTLLALATAVAGGGSLTGVIVIMVALAAFATVLFTVVRPVVDRLVVQPFRRTGRLSAEQLTVLLVGLFASAFVTSLIGVHELIGAFLFGVAVPKRDTADLFHAVTGRIEGVSVQLLLPIFFVIAGQGVRLLGLGADDIIPLLAILAVASVGKFCGSFVAARVTGVPKRQALAVGTMMNTRGLAELVILQVGREAGVISDKVYTMLVVMAVVTTASAGPLLKLVYPDRWLKRDIEEADRERATSVTDRAVVVVDDPALAADLVAIAQTYGGRRNTGHVTLVRLMDGTGLSGVVDSITQLDALQRVVVESGMKCSVITRSTTDRSTELVATIAAIAPGVVVVGNERSELIGRMAASGADVIAMHERTELSRGAVVNAGRSDDDLAALELGARAALCHDMPLTVHGSLPIRIRRQLERLGVRVAANQHAVAIAAGDAVRSGVGHSGAGVSIHAGSRDRVALADVLGGWFEPPGGGVVVVHASR
jgi:Kef-type K+ transport system membrane component KefB